MNDSQAIFSQRDGRWSRQKIGPSVLTIGGWGCTLTSTCRSLFLLTGKVMTPSEMENTLIFNSEGKIIWKYFDKVGLSAYRYYTKPNEFKKGMLLELDYNPNHWVCFEKENEDGTVQVMDPWVGAIVNKPISAICGYADVKDSEATYPEPTEWEKEVMEATEWVKEHSLSNGERPKDFVTREEAFVIVHRLAKKVMEWAKSQD